MAKLKPNSEKIKDFLATLQKSSFLPSNKKWWPKYLYHFSDVNNIVSILETHYLYSRNLAIEKGLLKVDIASTEVISNTKDQIMNFVRLYFRPRTPTQYKNEGVRPIDQREIHAHCPIPIYLMFDSEPILSHPESKFSNRNLAKKKSTYTGNIKKLLKFPFELIYHDSFFQDINEKEKIVAHRNAEVIIPNSINLDSLKFIFCRSYAEKDTLLNSLSKNASESWSGKIYVDSENNLFLKNWTFVEKAILSRGYIILHFPPDSKTPGPFTLRIVRHDLNTDEIISGEITPFMCEGRKTIKFKNNSEEYSIKVFLDNDLVYFGLHDQADLPI